MPWDPHGLGLGHAQLMGLGANSGVHGTALARPRTGLTAQPRQAEPTTTTKKFYL